MDCVPACPTPATRAGRGRRGGAIARGRWPCGVPPDRIACSLDPRSRGSPYPLRPPPATRVDPSRAGRADAGNIARGRKSPRRGGHDSMSRDDLRGTLAALLEEEMGESYDLADDREIREGLGPRLGRRRRARDAGRARIPDPPVDGGPARSAHRRRDDRPAPVQARRAGPTTARRPPERASGGPSRSPKPTTATPAAIRAVPSHRAGPTRSARNAWASSAESGYERAVIGRAKLRSASARATM